MGQVPLGSMRERQRAIGRTKYKEEDESHDEVRMMKPVRCVTRGICPNKKRLIPVLGGR
jgi:hypothetical protein